MTREIDALSCSQPKHELQKHQQQIHLIPNTKWDLGICLLPNSNKECSMQMTLKRRNGPDHNIRYQESATVLCCTVLLYSKSPFLRNACLGGQMGMKFGI